MVNRIITYILTVPCLLYITEIKIMNQLYYFNFYISIFILLICICVLYIMLYFGIMRNIKFIKSMVEGESDDDFKKLKRH